MLDAGWAAHQPTMNAHWQHLGIEASGGARAITAGVRSASSLKAFQANLEGNTWKCTGRPPGQARLPEQPDMSRTSVLRIVPIESFARASVRRSPRVALAWCAYQEITDIATAVGRHT